MENTEIKKDCVSKERIIQAIENWGDSTIVWLHLLSLLGEKHQVSSKLNGIKISHNHQKFNLSLHSSCGTGKSWNTIILVKFLQGFADMPFIKELHGFFTPKALIQQIIEKPDATFYVDEAEQLLNDVTIRSLLRQMSFGKGFIAWQTSREAQNISLVRFLGNTIMSRNDKLDSQGRIIDISNEHLKANLDRAIIITLKPDINEMIRAKQRQYENHIDKGAWDWIAKKIAELRQNPNEIDLDEQETKEIFEFWKQELRESRQENVSLRSFDKLIQLFARMKLFLGLDQDLICICRNLGKRIIKTSIQSNLFSNFINEMPLTRADLAKKMSEERGISLRQAQRMVANALERGEIKEINQIITP